MAAVCGFGSYSAHAVSALSGDKLNSSERRPVPGSNLDDDDAAGRLIHSRPSAVTCEVTDKRPRAS